MITAIHYADDRLGRPVEETRFLNPVPKKCDKVMNTHYWVTMGFNEPKWGSPCLCGEKEYRGLEYDT